MTPEAALLQQMLDMLPDGASPVEVLQGLLNDRRRLNLLQSPDFKFSYAIKADGQVALSFPRSGYFSGIREAVDFAQKHQR